MDHIIELIRPSYGGLYQLRPPLDEKQYDNTKEILPDDLYEILKISNGIYGSMTYPNDERVGVQRHCLNKIDVLIYLIKLFYIFSYKFKETYAYCTGLFC